MGMGTTGGNGLDWNCLWRFEPISYKFNLSGMRNTNRIRAVKFTIHYLIRLLREQVLIQKFNLDHTKTAQNSILSRF